jgi:hypothetical protein
VGAAFWMSDVIMTRTSGQVDRAAAAVVLQRAQMVASAFGSSQA